MLILILSADMTRYCLLYGGEGGVRTHVGLTPPTDFESVVFIYF